MTAHRDDSACNGAVVRNPPVKERAGDEETRTPWRFDRGADGGRKTRERGRQEMDRLRRSRSLAHGSLQVREQHLDLLSLTPRPDIGIRLRDVAQRLGPVRGLNAEPCGKAFWGNTAASQFASIAIVLAGAVEPCCTVIDTIPLENTAWVKRNTALSL